MTLEQLRIFVAVAERLHMTRAAEALNLTQSAVSAAVAALETRHGARLKRGAVRLFASQTIAAYWLPARMAAFARAHPEIDLHLSIGNTHRVVAAVLAGEAELGLVEGAVEAPRLEKVRIGADRLAVV